MFGVEKPLAMMNFVFGFAFGLGERWYWWFIITAIVHIALRYYSRREPQLRDVYMRYLHQSEHYDPWWHPCDPGKSARRYRAQNMGRGEPR